MIAQMRAMLAKSLSTLEWPVHHYKPDDINEVPCFVVDRPTVEVDVQNYVVRCSVIVIGRRINDEDAQGELDNVTEAAMLAIRGPEIDVSTVDPIIAMVAELTHPAYRIDCAAGFTNCY
jgi:hypothetical protein